MHVVYRVSVERVEYDDEGMVASSRNLFEASSPHPSRLIDYAPAEVRAALAQEAAEAYASSRMTPPAATWDRATGLAAVDAAGIPHPADVPPLAYPVEGEPSPETSETTGETPKPRRKRRTKAEIEADKAAAQQQNATASEQHDPPADPDDSVYGAGIPPMESGSFLATPPDEAVATVPAPAVPATPPPWNPFAK